MNFLRAASLVSKYPVSSGRLSVLLTLCVLTACQSGPGGRAIFQRIEIENKVAPGARVELIDVGGSTATDIILMNQRPGRLHWYENPSWQSQQIPVVADQFYGVAAVPRRQRGEVADLAVSGSFSQPGSGTRQQLVSLHNPGRDALNQAWLVSVIKADITPGLLFVADMSGTGQALLGSLPDIEVHSRVHSRSQWVSLPLLDNPPPNSRIRVYDWDLNGRDDLLVMSDRGLDIVALASRGRFVDEFRLFVTEPGQGFLDVAVGQSERPPRRFIAAISEDGERLQVFRPDPERVRQWTARTLSGPLNGGRVLRVADLNQDGYDELIVGGDAGLAVYYYDSEETAWRRYQIDSHPVADIAIADLSGNGFPDLVTTPAETGAVKLFQNRGRSN